MEALLTLYSNGPNQTAHQSKDNTSNPMKVVCKQYVVFHHHMMHNNITQIKVYWTCTQFSRYSECSKMIVLLAPNILAKMLTKYTNNNQKVEQWVTASIMTAIITPLCSLSLCLSAYTAAVRRDKSASAHEDTCLTTHLSSTTLDCPLVATLCSHKL